MAAITFEKISLIDHALTAEAGSPVFAEGIRGTVHIDAKSNIFFDFLAPREGESEHAFAARVPTEIKLNFADQLKSWLAGQEHVSGTPVDSVPWVTPAQAATLKGAGINSVELLADSSDGILIPLGLNGSVLRMQAKQWLDKAAGKAMADIGRMKQENDELREMLQQQAEAIKALQAQAGSSPEDKPRDGTDQEELEDIRAELLLMGIRLHHNSGLEKARQVLAEAKSAQVNNE